MPNKILRSGNFLCNGKRVYWKVVASQPNAKRTLAYGSSLYMRLSGEKYALQDGAVHSSISSGAIRDYARQFLRRRR